MNFGIGSWRINGRLEEAFTVSGPIEEHPGCNYVYAEEQKRVVAHMAVNIEFVIAQALRGMPSCLIAAGNGVSREAINARLRRIGLANPRGRPKSLQPVPSR